MDYKEFSFLIHVGYLSEPQFQIDQQKKEIWSIASAYVKVSAIRDMVKIFFLMSKDLHLITGVIDKTSISWNRLNGYINFVSNHVFQ